MRVRTVCGRRPALPGLSHTVIFVSASVESVDAGGQALTPIASA